MSRYRAEVLPLDPGQVTEILTAFAAGGWELAASYPVPVTAGSPLAPGGPRQGVGLFCVLRHPGPAAEANGEAPPGESAEYGT